MNNIQAKAKPVFDALLGACKTIVTRDGKHPNVTMVRTSYVVEGRTYALKTASSQYTFWVGINGSRLFFIAYMGDVTPRSAQEAFSFCFGGAEKVGWHVNYEEIEDGVSVWATCMTDQSKPLIDLSSSVSNRVTEQEMFALSESGQFWVTDIAMMAQSWIRTSERKGISCHEREPAPL